MSYECYTHPVHIEQQMTFGNKLLIIRFYTSLLQIAEMLIREGGADVNLGVRGEGDDHSPLSLARGNRHMVLVRLLEGARSGG